MKTIILFSMLYCVTVKADISCPDSEVQKSVLESSLISIKTHQIYENDLAFEILFPKEYLGKVLTSSQLVVGDQTELLAVIPLKLSLQEGAYSTAIRTQDQWTDGVYVLAQYGGCLTLGKTVRPHNKSLNTDTVDDGAG